MQYEDNRFLGDDDDDSEGQDLCSSPPSRCSSPDVDHVLPMSPSAVNEPIPLEDAQSSKRPMSTQEWHRRHGAKLRKTRKRVRIASTASPYDPGAKCYKTRSKTIDKLEKVAESSVKFNVKSLKVAGAGAFTGKRERFAEVRPPTPAELRRRGYLEVPWNDGYVGATVLSFVLTTYMNSPPVIVGDEKARAFAVFAQKPVGGNWDESMRQVQAALQEARVSGLTSGAFDSMTEAHRRGNFLAFASGVSFGGGQRVSDMQAVLF